MIHKFKELELLVQKNKHLGIINYASFYFEYYYSLFILTLSNVLYCYLHQG